MTSINFIKFENVQSFLTKVDEEINTKYISNFIYTQIQSHNLTLDNNSKIHYFYIKKIKSYQISVIKDGHKNSLIEPYVFAVNYLEKKQNSVDLYICDNFFVLYEKGQLVYFKDIKSGFEKKDIITYVNQTFSTNINNIYEINTEQLNEYKLLYQSKNEQFPPLKYITKQNNKNGLFYIAHLILVSVILVTYFFSTYNQDVIQLPNDIKNIKLEKAKNEYEILLDKYEDNKKVTLRLITLFNLLDTNGIKLITLKISENKSDIMMKATKKEVLLDFLDFYDEDSTINNMRYIQEGNCYELYATVKLY